MNPRWFHSGWALFAALAVCTAALPARAAEAGSATPPVLVLTNGKAMAIAGTVQMRGPLLVFHLPDGTLVSLRSDQIDEEKTREAARERARSPAGREEAEPAQGTSRPVVSTDPLEARVSLDLKDADLVDVLRFLADQAGMNLVVSSDVKGTVTLRLNDVTVGEALDVILKTMGLAVDRSTRVLNVFSRR